MKCTCYRVESEDIRELCPTHGIPDLTPDARELLTVSKELNALASTGYGGHEAAGANRDHAWYVRDLALRLQHSGWSSCGIRPPGRWHRLYVTVDDRRGTVWEIQRLDGGGEYRIVRDQVEVGTRRAGWDSARAQFSRLEAPLLPFSDEPQVRAGEHSFVVTHGSRKCEVGRAVVRDENAALSYAAAVFEMDRKGRSDHEFCRRLGV